MTELKMPTRNNLLRRDRPEGGLIGSFKEMLALLQRQYDLSGSPDIKQIIDRAHAALGEVPH